MKTFYDIHMHAFDLKYLNLSVFLQREDLIDGLVDSIDILSLTGQRVVVVCLFYRYIVPNGTSSIVRHLY